MAINFLKALSHSTVSIVFSPTRHTEKGLQYFLNPILLQASHSFEPFDSKLASSDLKCTSNLLQSYVVAYGLGVTHQPLYWQNTRAPHDPGKSPKAGLLCTTSLTINIDRLPRSTFRGHT
eukprot:Gb_28730 [translate_table: standard]